MGGQKEWWVHITMEKLLNSNYIGDQYSGTTLEELWGMHREFLGTADSKGTELHKAL